MRKTPPELRFWDKVNKAGPVARVELGPCWLWTASHDTCGYGLFYPTHNTSTHAHRFAYILTNGLVDPTLDVLHKCDVRDCVNPAHLFAGTVTDNMLDMHRKRRHSVRKLSDEQVREVRLRVANGESECRIARSLGVHSTAVHHIVSGKNHKYVT
jgi:hypothetical protein